MQVCTSLQIDNHASTPPLSFLQAGCPSCRPTNSVKALKAMINFSTGYNTSTELKLEKHRQFEQADKDLGNTNNIVLCLPF